jgi:hypothetical protein
VAGVGALDKAQAGELLIRANTHHSSPHFFFPFPFAKEISSPLMHI